MGVNDIASGNGGKSEGIELESFLNKHRFRELVKKPSSVTVVIKNNLFFKPLIMLKLSNIIVLRFQIKAPKN